MYGGSSLSNGAEHGDNNVDSRSLHSWSGLSYGLDSLLSLCMNYSSNLVLDICFDPKYPQSTYGYNVSKNQDLKNSMTASPRL